MSRIILLDETTVNPITKIGSRAGCCWGADVTDPEKNYKRGLECLKSNHGRTFEFVNVEAVLDGYSARVIREWYTHIGGAPTRLQASTRYIDYKYGFNYITPPSIAGNLDALNIYTGIMSDIADGLKELEDLGIPHEDTALALPLGMTTNIVCKHNLRNLIDMSRQRMCTRAYHEYRDLFSDLLAELSAYSEEWALVVQMMFKPKCEELGYCPESQGCGRMPKRF